MVPVPKECCQTSAQIHKTAKDLVGGVFHQDHHVTTFEMEIFLFYTGGRGCAMQDWYLSWLNSKHESEKWQTREQAMMVRRQKVRMDSKSGSRSYLPITTTALFVHQKTVSRRRVVSSERVRIFLWVRTSTMITLHVNMCIYGAQHF